MKLSPRTLSRLFYGAIYFETERGYLSPYRYSKAQIEYMSRPDYDAYWLSRALICGPMRIELKTDATKISFEYKTSEPHERSNTIDLYIDGALSEVYFIKSNLKGKVEFSLPEGEKRVSIYMPCESILKIKNFTLNGHYKSVKKPSSKLLIIGDSITQGAGPDISSEAYANILSRELKYEVIAQGIGGYRYEPRDLMRIDGLAPDMILVLLGTNSYEASALERGYDYSSSVKEFYNRLVTLYQDTKIVCVTPIYRTRELDMERFKWCINEIRGACAPHKQITVIDGFTLMPNLPLCLADGVHPSTYGSHMLGMSLANELKKLK